MCFKSLCCVHYGRVMPPLWACHTSDVGVPYCHCWHASFVGMSYSACSLGQKWNSQLEIELLILSLCSSLWLLQVVALEVEVCNCLVRCRCSIHNNLVHIYFCILL